MSMFPFVKKGDEFKPDVNFDNACRSIVNQFHSYSTPASKGNIESHTIVPCYNSMDYRITAGSSVCFDDDADVIVDAILPVKICDDENKRWGVAEHDIEPGSFGRAIFSGVARIPFNGDEEYVTPDLKGGYQGSQHGFVEVLYKLPNGESLVLINGKNAHNASYKGPFSFSIDDETKKLKISSGFLVRNGKFLTVNETLIDVMKDGSGYVCVTSKFNSESNTFDSPKIEIAEPAADAYPVGSVTVVDSTRFTYECYKIPMVIIVYTKECPLAAKYNR